MTAFIAVLAIAAFAATARIVDRLIALLIVIALVNLAWLALNGGVAAVESSLSRLATLAIDQRAPVAGAALGLVLGRPLAVVLNPSNLKKE